MGGNSGWYCTREDVQDALDTRDAAHSFMSADRAAAAATEAVNQLLNRHKHGLQPRVATRYFDWPGNNYSAPTRLWLDENELIELTSLTAGGTALTSGEYFLEPVNSGPPYTYIEINLNSQGSFSNAGTTQRAIAAVGLFGYWDEQKAAGTLGAAQNGTQTTVQVSDASLVGVGDILAVGDERQVVTGRSPVDTTQNLGADMAALKNVVALPVSDGTQFHVGEIVLIDSERMKVSEVAGNTLTVIRGYDGSVLAAHTTGADIYAYRLLVVERGALGTTAAAHLQGDTVTKWEVPSLVKSLAIAEALTFTQQEAAGYGRRTYSDEAERDSAGTELFSGRGLTDIRRACRLRYGRNFRKRAV